MKTRITIVASLSLLILATIAMISCFGSKEKAVRRLPANLNETLTNEVSDTAVMNGFDRQVKDYMTAWGLKGVSLSVEYVTAAELMGSIEYEAPHRAKLERYVV